ncbi:MAG: FAD-binding oxidoreductase [Leptospiraceae bacterium]|nr:FAD-binding oxidoreductase [Leptospiraceae bacterium]MDW8306357.1 FAD-dependent oxidoreductase [Leptospiraceae bacterium]
MPRAYVVGCGVAGLSASLAAQKAGFETFLFDMAHEAFYHTSGRNAAIGRSYEADPFLGKWQKETIKTLLAFPHILKPCGLLIRALEKDYSYGGANHELPDGLVPRSFSYVFPDGSSFSGEFLAANGIIDLRALAGFLLNQCQLAGIKLFWEHELLTLHYKATLLDELVLFSKSTKKTKSFGIRSQDIFINAAGAWAAHVGAMVGSQVAIIPHKRHLFYLKPPESKALPRELPVIWDEHHDFYLRPAGEYILATPGDQTACAPGDYVENPNMRYKMLHILQTHLPYFADFEIVTSHTCLRTFTRDHRPVVGFDPKITNFFWNAGWGGHGISLSLGIIPFLEDLLKKGPRKENEVENPFTVFRFF